MDEYGGVAEGGKVEIEIFDRVSWGCGRLDDVNEGSGGGGGKGSWSRNRGTATWRTRSRRTRLDLVCPVKDGMTRSRWKWSSRL